MCLAIERTNEVLETQGATCAFGTSITKQMTGDVAHATWTLTNMRFGKRNTQKIERKNLNLRTFIKRLTRKTICFSKFEVIHDVVMGLLFSKVEFGRNIYS